MTTLENYKERFSSIHRQIECFNNETKKRQKVLQVANRIKNVMERENIFINVLMHNEYLAIEPRISEGQDIFLARKLIRMAFPDYIYQTWTDYISSVDIPGGDYILVRYQYNNNKAPDSIFNMINIWVRYENENDLPNDITKNGTCKFVEKIATEKTFTCLTKEINND